MSSRNAATASTRRRRIRGAADFTALEAAEAWLVQARRLLAAMDWPVESAKIEATPDRPTALVEAASEGETATADAADAVLDWAQEAAARVLRGDPQPSDTEVYKAARGLAR